MLFVKISKNAAAIRGSEHCRGGNILPVVASRPNKPQAFNAPLALSRNLLNANSFRFRLWLPHVLRWIKPGQCPVFTPATPFF